MKLYIPKFPVVIVHLGMGVLLPHLIIGCQILSPNYILQGIVFGKKEKVKSTFSNSIRESKWGYKHFPWLQKI